MQQAHNVAYINNIHGTALRYGVWLECVVDITRLYRIYFSPSYWEQSGLAGAPVTSTSQEIVKSYLYDNATAVVFRRVDWAQVYILEADNYRHAIRLLNKPPFQIGSYVFAGPSNGIVYGARITNCKSAIRADEIQPGGWLFSNCTITGTPTPKPGDNSYGVYAKDSLDFALLFNSCTLGDIWIESGCSGGISIENCTIEGQIYVDDGQLSLVNSAFTQNEINFFVDGAAEKVMLAGCQYYSYQTQNGGDVVTVSAPDQIEITDVTFDFPDVPSTGSNRVFNVKYFGAKGNHVDDDTSAFVDALLEAGSVGGGTVYVPAGRYRITSPLTVPSGVELRGIFEAPPHLMVIGSMLLVECGQGSETGTPFISLESGSGIQGLNICHVNQDFYDMQPYPWTIRALGSGCWVRNICLVNPWQGVDFATASDTSNHYIAGLVGAPMKRGLKVANSLTGGYVEGMQFVIHYWTRNDQGLAMATKPADDFVGFGFMKDNLTAFEFSNCSGQQVLNPFVYAPLIGLYLHGNFDGIFHLFGADRDEQAGIHFAGNVNAEFVGTCLCPYSDVGYPSKSLYFDSSFTGEAKMINTNVWGFGHDFIEARGTGSINLGQVNLSSIYNSYIYNLNVYINNIYSTNGHTVHWDVASPVPAAMCFWNCTVD